MIDSEIVVGGYLRETTGERVVGKTPPNTDAPWVRLTQLDADNVTGTTEVEAWHDYVLQLDCYAGKGGYANQLAIDVRDALVALPQDPPSDAVVTQVTFQGQVRLPDEGFEPARERVILTATVKARAA